jgi:hypothetical protein
MDWSSDLIMGPFNSYRGIFQRNVLPHPIPLTKMFGRPFKTASFKGMFGPIQCNWQNVLEKCWAHSIFRRHIWAHHREELELFNWPGIFLICPADGTEWAQTYSWKTLKVSWRHHCPQRLTVALEAQRKNLHLGLYNLTPVAADGLTRIQCNNGVLFYSRFISKFSPL